MNAILSKRDDAFSETTVDDEVVLLNLSDGTFFSLTGTGAAIWRLIDGSRDRQGLIASLAEDYGSDAGTIAPDVDAFLARLDEAGFLA